MAAEIFLSQDDRHRLQEIYEFWNDNVNPKRLVPLLYKHRVITTRDKQEIEARTTEYAQNDYIFDYVLMKSPYDQLELMHQILLEIGDSTHKRLAELLPRRRGQNWNHVAPFRDLSRGDEILSEPIQATTVHSLSHLGSDSDTTFPSGSRYANV